MNNSISLHEFEAAFIGLMATNGLTPESSILQYERIIRFSADKNRSKKDEWYWCVNGLSERENVYFYGVYGSWSAGTKFEYNSWKEQRLDEKDIQLPRVSIRLQTAKLLWRLTAVISCP